MRFLTLFLSCLLCSVGMGRRWALFSAVQSAAGRTQCSPLPPLVTLRARSRLDCSDQCAQRQDVGCVAFNFKQGTPSNCELFNAHLSNYTEVPGCTLYQVSKNKSLKTRLCPIHPLEWLRPKWRLSASILVQGKGLMQTAKEMAGIIVTVSKI